MQDTGDNYLSAFVSVKNDVPTMLDATKPGANIVTRPPKGRFFGQEGGNNIANAPVHYRVFANRHGFSRSAEYRGLMSRYLAGEISGLID